jgi:hypothetical protein
MPVPLDSLGFLGIILNLKIIQKRCKDTTYYGNSQTFWRKKSMTCPLDPRKSTTFLEISGMIASHFRGFFVILQSERAIYLIYE